MSSKAERKMLTKHTLEANAKKAEEREQAEAQASDSANVKERQAEAQAFDSAKSACASVNVGEGNTYDRKRNKQRSERKRRQFLSYEERKKIPAS
jgi:hypothetical protein